MRGKKMEFINSYNIKQLIDNYTSDYDKIHCFKVSNTTGENIDSLRKFISNLRPNPNMNFGDIQGDKSTFIIDDSEDRFRLKGIGIVVSGIVKEGSFTKEQICYSRSVFSGRFKRLY